MQRRLVYRSVNRMKEIQNLQKIFKKEFKWFHKHPELPLEKYETTKQIEEILQKGKGKQKMIEISNVKKVFKNKKTEVVL